MLIFILRIGRKKRIFLSFYELREYLGFTYKYYNNVYNATGKIDEANDFFIYCEMLLNLIKDMIPNSQYNIMKEK